MIGMPVMLYHPSPPSLTARIAVSMWSIVQRVPSEVLVCKRRVNEL